MNKIVLSCAFKFLIVFIMIINSANAINAKPDLKLKNNNFLIYPHGRYYVGFEDRHLINTSACPSRFSNKSNNAFFSTNNQKKCDEIWLRLYYPTIKSGSSSYLPTPSLIDDIKSANKSITKSEINELLNIKSYTLLHAPIERGKFSTLFFSPGYGILGQQYENIITNLVSHGYIVVTINSQFINGKLMLDNGHIVDILQPTSLKQKKNLFLNSQGDLSFTYHYLKDFPGNEPVINAIDWDRIGLIGHSLGAATVSHFSTHTAIKAIAALDLTIDLLNKKSCESTQLIPFLHLFSSQMYLSFQSTDLPCLSRNTKLSKTEYLVILYNPKDVHDREYSMHLNFADYSTLQYHPTLKKALHVINRGSKRFLGTGNGIEISEMINNKLLTFFDRYLNSPKPIRYR